MKYLHFVKMDKANDGTTGGSGGGGGQGGSNQGGAQNADGGAGGGQSGGSGNDGGQGGGAGGSTQVSKDDHDRALADLHRFKKAAKENEDKIQTLQDQINQLQKSGLRAKEDWKTLSEEQAKEIEDLKKANDSLKNGIAKTFRSMQVRSEAKALGIREDALKDLDLLDFSSDVQVVFATDGTVSVEGAKAAAEGLKKTRSHWFTTGNVQNINTGGKGGGEPQELTAAYMNELERKDPAKYKQLFPKYVKQVAARKK